MQEMKEMWVQSLDQEDSPDEEMAIHSSILAWRRKWQSTPVFLPGESHGQRSLVSYSPRGRKESDMTEHACVYADWPRDRNIWTSWMALVEKNPPANSGDVRCGFNLWVRESLWRRVWQLTPVFLPGESHGQRSLVGYSLWGQKRVRHDRDSTGDALQETEGREDSTAVQSVCYFLLYT